MKKSAIIFVIFSTGLVNAEMAAPDEMEQVCKNWLNNIVTQKGHWSGSENPKIEEIISVYENDRWLANCYNINPNGFVIVRYPDRARSLHVSFPVEG